ncbi:Galactinol synthase 4 [Forsythia ovata]|uniref:Hexosyltransferase n=1 Tax=Forsythia ovata TaxID=205694 RepID=A0ABD1TCX9_9LAMI
MAPEVPLDVFASKGKVPKVEPKKAYVTFLAGNGDYVKGVVGLVKGLRKVKSAYPLVVAILPDVPEEHRELLRSQGCIVREIEPIYPPQNQIQFAMAYYVINYSKLRIWNDFLNMFFEKVYKPIPLLYNLVLAMLWRHPENVELEQVKVVHYCAAGSKPWRYTGVEANMEREDIKMLVKKWWDVYDDPSLDFKAEDTAPTAEEGTFSKSSILASLPEPAVAYIPAPSAA